MTSAQETQWAGEFGDAYHERAPGSEECNYQMLLKAFARATKQAGGCQVASVLELGAGTGAHLRAAAKLFRGAETMAVEINDSAIAALRARHPKGYQPPNVWAGSILDFNPLRQHDLVMTKGFLIHIPPEHLPQVYDIIHAAAGHWILLAEYYNPRHVPITYRGAKDLLWKGDFAGDLLERHKDLRLADYGFVYHQDAYPQDDLTWMLLEKHRTNPDMGVR